jgi:hypothetical protein
MKVYFGPFPTRWTVTRLERWWYETRYKKWEWEIEDEEKDRIDRIFDRVCDFFQKVLNVTINKIVFRRKRKEKVKLHGYDTWSADHTLALIIFPMLKQLRDTKCGSPLVDSKDAPGISNNDEAIHERWTYVLNEMIWAFEQIAYEDEGHKYYYVPYKKNETVLRMKIGDKYYETEEQARERGKLDMKKYREYNKRIDNGLRLFGKYYRGLWD